MTSGGQTPFLISFDPLRPPLTSPRSPLRQIAIIFDKTLAPPVLGWSSAIASFGAFLIPRFFATAIQQVRALDPPHPCHGRSHAISSDLLRPPTIFMRTFIAELAPSSPDLRQGSPEMPFFIFGAYYATCILVNWYFYFRSGAEKPC